MSHNVLVAEYWECGFDNGRYKFNCLALETKIFSVVIHFLLLRASYFPF